MKTPDIRTIIVDDEPLAREGLRIVLEPFKGVEIVAEAGNGTEALESIREHCPDLVFLDIEMPDLNGFDVLSRLSQDALPHVVFVTAYDQYAVRAFEIHAVDYLLKPIDRQQTQRAIDRIRKMMMTAEPTINAEKLNRLLQSMGKTAEIGSDKITIKADGEVHFLKKKDIPLIEANGDYINVYCAGRTYLVHEKLKKMEQSLAGQGFVRIHRSSIINRARITSVRNAAFGEFEFTLEGCTKKVRSSRSYHRVVQDLIDPD